MPPIPLVLVGINNYRAHEMARYTQQHADTAKLVAVVERDAAARHAFGDAYHIPMRYRFATWEDWLDAPVLGDLALICDLHPNRIPATIYAAKAGYTILLDAPISPSYAECLQLLEWVGKRQVMVAHGLRFSAIFRAVHDFVKRGRLGKIIQYQQAVAVPSWYAAHQFQRQPNGYANNLLLDVGVHEVDMACWILADQEIDTIRLSESSRDLFPESAPMEGIPPQRCIDDCPIEAECFFSAVGTYQKQRYAEAPQGMLEQITRNNPTPQGIATALEKTPWGACVYHHKQHVQAHQKIDMHTTTGTHIQLQMDSMTAIAYRAIHIDGENGKIHAEFAGMGSHITIQSPLSDSPKTMKFPMRTLGYESGLMGNLLRMARGEIESIIWLEDVIQAYHLIFAAQAAHERPLSIANFMSQAK